jgi:hypothetical protein
MKKSQSKPGEKEKPRRLTLSRETIQLLDDPARLKLAGGGSGNGETYYPSLTTTENTMC